METPSRIKVELQAEVVAYHLWDNGPVKADYAGQAFDILAGVLNAHLQRRNSFGRTDAAKVVQWLYEHGYVVRNGTTALVTEVRWIHYEDPHAMQWGTPPKEKRTGRMMEIEEHLASLERRMQAMEKRLDAASIKSI